MLKNELYYNMIHIMSAHPSIRIVKCRNNLFNLHNTRICILHREYHSKYSYYPTTHCFQRYCSFIINYVMLCITSNEHTPNPLSISQTGFVRTLMLEIIPALSNSRNPTYILAMRLQHTFFHYTCYTIYTSTPHYKKMPPTKITTTT